MNRREFFDEWSRLHGGVEVNGIIRIWLSISFSLVKVLAVLRITPHALTTLSLAFAFAFLYFAQYPWALSFLLLSLMMDGLDGSLAIYREKSTLFGAALDSTVDRVSEFLWVLGLIKIGIPARFVLAIWLLGFIQEYLRARAGGLGVRDISQVTPTERPVRASFIFAIFIFEQLNLNLTQPTLWLWLALQIYSLIILTKNFRSLLQ
jgi:archaetidylinositol phosphate synthase